MNDGKILNFEKPTATAKPERKDTCANCIFAEFDLNNQNMASCHFNPPQVLVVPQQHPITQAMVLSVSSYFPVVMPDGWCGGFERGMDEASFDGED
jgi:hypothetical protein